MTLDECVQDLHDAMGGILQVILPDHIDTGEMIDWATIDRLFAITRYARQMLGDATVHNASIIKDAWVGGVPSSPPPAAGPDNGGGG